LNCGGIGEAADHAPKGIHFMHQLAFGGSTDGRVAGLPSDAVEIEAEQSSVQAQACRGYGRFTSGMASANDDHIEGFSGGGSEAHAFIIRSRAI
jgi:hypothetical protein